MRNEAGAAIVMAAVLALAMGAVKLNRRSGRGRHEDTVTE